MNCRHCQVQVWKKNLRMESHRLPALPPRKCGHRVGVFSWEICSGLLGVTEGGPDHSAEASRPQSRHSVGRHKSYWWGFVHLLGQCIWSQGTMFWATSLRGPGQPAASSVQLCSESWPVLLSIWLPGFGQNLPKVQYPVDSSCQIRYSLLILFICLINVR